MRACGWSSKLLMLPAEGIHEKNGRHFRCTTSSRGVDTWACRIGDITGILWLLLVKCAVGIAEEWIASSSIHDCAFFSLLSILFDHSTEPWTNGNTWKIQFRYLTNVPTVPKPHCVYGLTGITDIWTKASLVEFSRPYYACRSERTGLNFIPNWMVSIFRSPHQGCVRKLIYSTSRHYI